MKLEEKIELNKLIRTYDGSNTFIISLQKQLKTNKFLEKVLVGKKTIKLLSIAQYESAKTVLS